MTPIITVLDETEQQLAPLERRYCLAEWDAAVGGDDTAEDRVVEASLALEDVLSDPDRFARSSSATAPDDPLGARRLTLLRDESRGLPASARPRRAHRAPRGEPADALLEASRADRRPPGLEQRDRRDPAQLERSRRAPGCLGRVEGDRPEGRRAGARARPAAQRGRARPRLPRPLRDGARAAGARRGLAVRAARPARHVRSRPRGRAEKAAIDDAQRARLGIAADERAAAVGLRGRVLPGRAARRRTTRSRRRSPRSTRWRPHARTSARSATRSRRSSSAATSTPARRSTRARSASRSIAATTCASSRTSSRASAGSRRCCTSSATASTTSRSSATCRGCCAATRTSSRPRRSRCCTAARRAIRSSCARYCGVPRTSSRTRRSTGRSSGARCTS